MQVFYDFEASSQLSQEFVVTVGVFDALHIGHQAIIQQVLAQAEELNLSSLVLVFHPPPLAFLAPEKRPPPLTTLPKKIEVLQQLGVEMAVFARFDAYLQQMSPETFVQEVLLQRLHAKGVVVGYDWHFGKGRAGNVEILKQLGERYQLGVTVVGPTQLHGLPVHSTRVREAIANEDLDLAAQLLGRRYSISGEVVTGDRRGSQIGFPTANINPGDQMLPPNGVYAIQAKLEGRLFDGVLNMGTRPTFGGIKFQIEAHLFDFEGMVYGKEIEIFFIKKIRDERAFPNPEALVNQIKQDVVQAKEILNPGGK